jgi:glycosyltransferase involved in cell wall biosynthesis
MRIALVSREITPFSGGGIAPAVRAAAELLSSAGHEVTVVTAGDHEKEYHQRLRAGDSDLTASGVDWAFVPRPREDSGGHLGFASAWSASVYRTLRATYPAVGPDLIEFADYLAEGFATVQARRTNDPWLNGTTVAVRIHTTSEMCAVLDGALPTDHASRALFDMERYCLEHADRVVHQGGDIYETYVRFYGAERLAPEACIPYAATPAVRATAPAGSADSRTGAPLEVLYLGRLERRKGVHDLATALSATTANLRVRFVGGDTDTAPLAASVAEQLAFVAEGNPRMQLDGPVPRDEVIGALHAADVLIVPSRWECWPNVMLEALAANRPILATPVGGMIEMVGDAGWLTPATGPEAIAGALERLAHDPEAARRLSRDGTPRRRFEELTEPTRILRGYEELTAAVRPRPTPARFASSWRPVVSVIVPYFQLDGTLPDTLASLAAQDYPAIETIIINDGSFRDEDAGLWDVAARYGARVVTQPNAGLSAARNLGVAVSAGAFILPLDADDEIDPGFVSRCVAALTADPTLAYVTSWVTYVDEDGAPHGDHDIGYFPFGNWSSLLSELNVAGTCSAVIRREVFRDHGLRYDTELASYEDWSLYRQMAARGLYGAVIPEQLFRYRVRRDSMTRQDAQPHLGRLLNELRANDIDGAMRWEAARG